ncbi:GntR family transcriptional regulator [Telmatospirillum sp. J64-1]|uniref:GntR family transcriptional regulator n=1 Tax=Telmatospirillum sp. J64-1 TaxID=2502183 RepID=UPI00115DA431|nr:GntR family transcriptional regulator [Telmatospirillum sp. J64-1]
MVAIARGAAAAEEGSGASGGSVSAERRIYEAIHDAIAERRLPAGTKLVEDHLAGIFGVSRARIRKVLHSLAHDKLVTLQPNRGAFVAHPTVKEARDVFTARRVIEEAITRIVAREAGAAELRRLERHIAAEEAAHQRHDRRAEIKLSGEFHLLLAEIADNIILADLLKELVLRSSLIIAVYEAPGAVGCSPEEHRDLLERLVAGDVDGAAAVMERHLRAVEARLALDVEEPGAVDLRNVFAGMGGLS